MSDSSTKIILHLVCKLLLTKKDRVKGKNKYFWGALNLSKIKKCTNGFTDGVLTAVLGTVFEKLPPVISEQPFLGAVFKKLPFLGIFMGMGFLGLVLGVQFLRPLGG